MAKPKLPMHVEARRGWFSGVSTTLCGLTLKVNKASHFAAVTCPACAAARKAMKKGNR
ncbi:MAG: hypothetical protein M3548_17930 [Actinomycetota bacterium]|nr:hypothetical protein [Actinomycetota bacterium]